MSDYIMDLRKIVGHRPLLQVGASVIVVDCHNRILLQLRSDNHCWAYAGGSVELDEVVEDTARRELFEETGIRAEEWEFELLGSDRDAHALYDFYCLCRQTPIEQIVLLPGETDDVQWADFDTVHQMIREKKICKIIAHQFLRQEPLLLSKMHKNPSENL